MKILFTRFPLESAYGGAEVQTLTLMEGLIADGHAVAFAGSCAVLLEECKKRGIPAAECHIGPPPVTKAGAISFAWRKRAMKKKLITLLGQFHDLDAIAMLSLSEKLLLTDVAAAKKINVVWIEHDTVGRWLTKNPWMQLLLKQSAKAVTVGVSELSRRLYVEMGWNKERTVAIPNGIADIPVSTAAHDTDALHLLCVARLSSEKGVDILLQAIRHLGHVTLDIVGEGKDEAALQSLAHSLDLKGRVRFLGRKQNVTSMYASFDALVLPSREHDPFGLVAAEAMMAGVPAIVTDACGIAEYLTHAKDGLVVPAEDTAALTDAIRLLSDRKIKERMGAEAAKTAREKFSAKKMVSAYETVFTETSNP